MNRIEERHIAQARNRLDELWSPADDLLTPDQRRRFAELRAEPDVERRGRRTVELAEELIAEAESGAEEFEQACLRRGIHLLEFDRMLHGERSTGEAVRSARADADDFIRRTAEQAKSEWTRATSPVPTANWRRMPV